MKKFLLSVLVLVSSLIILSAQTPLQPGVTFSNVPIVQNFIYQTTPLPSDNNWRIALFTELNTIPAAQAIMVGKVAFNNSGTVPLPPPIVDPTTVCATPCIAFINVPTQSQVIMSPDKGINDFVTTLLAQMVALNSTPVDAVLTKYNVQIVQGTTKLFPRS